MVCEKARVVVMSKHEIHLSQTQVSYAIVDYCLKHQLILQHASPTEYEVRLDLGKAKEDSDKDVHCYLKLTVG